MDLRAVLTKIRAFLAFVSPVTPIKTDDALVTVIDALLADADLFGWFQRKVEDHNNGTLQLESDPPVALQVSLEARAIDWNKLLELVPVLIQLIGLFK
jgi:hypothetical protein